MFRSIVSCLLITFFIGCSNQNKTFISGKIIKPTNNEILILKDEKIIKKITINNQGTFSSSIENLNNVNNLARKQNLKHRSYINE